MMETIAFVGDLLLALGILVVGSAVGCAIGSLIAWPIVAILDWLESRGEQ